MIIVKVKVVSLFISSGLVNFEYLAYVFMVMIEWEKNLKLWWLWEVYWGLETTLFENVVWVVNGVREVFLFNFSEFLGFSSFKAWVRTTSCLLPVYSMIFYSNKICCVKKKKKKKKNLQRKTGVIQKFESLLLNMWNVIIYTYYFVDV